MELENALVRGNVPILSQTLALNRFPPFLPEDNDAGASASVQVWRSCFLWHCCKLLHSYYPRRNLINLALVGTRVRK